MAKFASIAKGTRATKPVTLPLDGNDVPLAVRPLTGLELGEVLAGARAYAISKGIASPKEGDRLYDLGDMANTLLLSCVDSEALEVPFFASVAEILEHLDADRIALLYEHQQAWQDECSPRQGEMDGGQYIATVMECAGWESGKPDPLRRLRPFIRPSFLHTLANQYLDSLKRNSPSSSESEPKAPDS